MKWTIVTGDSGGLGGSIAETLLENESRGVIGISRKSNDRVLALTAKYGDRYVHLDYDLSDPAGIKELYRRSVRSIGPLSGLVNNSATAYDEIVTNADPETLARMYNINALSPIMLTKYALRDMLLHRTKGSIVFISSVSAHTGYKGLSMYASTKGALEAFSRGVAREWGGQGIRSNCVSPGFMETAMSESLPDDLRDKIYRRTSLGGPTAVDSVARTVAYLLSEQAAAITGTTVRVDNGSL
ncbi:SDR family NAD(P)-dependent oxidoreductase [Paenibacillaceae bacterium WGS1546]|uniref:SDR family NAD(P)-dependent oxidoreductase n=1 Tax=Cohnella sp. WGS1546 TaxID=3366810 RepID=UPI00372D275F